MFMARLPARKFRSYVCTGPAALESKLRNTHGSDDENEDAKGEATETIEVVYGDRKAVAGVVETAMNVA